MLMCCGDDETVFAVLTNERMLISLAQLQIINKYVTQDCNVTEKMEMEVYLELEYSNLI